MQIVDESEQPAVFAEELENEEKQIDSEVQVNLDESIKNAENQEPDVQDDKINQQDEDRLPVEEIEIHPEDDE